MIRSGQPRQQYASSQLLDLSIAGPHGRCYVLRKPTPPDLWQVDKNWPPQRPSGAEHAHWNWTQVADHLTERWGLFCDDAPVALWCSTAQRLLRLNGQLGYRVDYLEVAASHLGAGIGQLCVALICQRAVELTANAVLIPSLPQSASFWRAVGATEGGWHGWKAGTNLLPFYLDGAALGAKARHASAQRIHHAG